MTNEQAAKNFSAQNDQWDQREKHIGELSFLAGILYAGGQVPDSSLIPDEQGNIDTPVLTIVQNLQQTDSELQAPEAMLNEHIPPNVEVDQTKKKAAVKK